MMKLNFEQWKEKYIAKISQEQLDFLKDTHGIENPEKIIEENHKIEYEKYVNGFWDKVLP